METIVALIGIVVEDMNSVMELNNILHEYNSYIIGRMVCRRPWQSLHNEDSSCG